MYCLSLYLHLMNLSKIVYHLGTLSEDSLFVIAIYDYLLKVCCDMNN